MPLSDIPISQPCSCYSNNRLTIRSQAGLHNKYLIGNERGLRLASAFSWKTVCDMERWGKHYTLEINKVWWRRLRIKAIATLETTSVPKNNGAKGCQSVLRMDMDSVGSDHSDFQMESSSEDSTELDEREKLRRMKISEANKGKIPWNKGRTELDEREKLRRIKISEANKGKKPWNKGGKHSPATLQKIKERTWVAMQDPKVKMKLLTVRDARSEETKIRIGVGVRLGWERRRQKLMVQETCHHEWQNLIALAAKMGLSGEKELQWDSYQILNEELVGELLKSIEQKKSTPRTRIKGNMRAPKSAEHKRKIAEAIAAKWADPEFRNRMRSGRAKYYGTPEGIERRPRRKLSANGLPRKRSPKSGMAVLEKHETKSPAERKRSNRSKEPLYKDPLASSKLEMLKNIRAQRAASVDKQSVAITRARLLIAEAEKAVQALETAAKTNPFAEASVIESRMLISEAQQIIKSIEAQETILFENGNNLSENSTARVPTLENEADPNVREAVLFKHVKVNGVESNFEKLSPNDLVETGENLFHLTSSNGHIPLPSKDLDAVEANPNGSSGLDCTSENLEGLEKQIKLAKECKTKNVEGPGEKIKSIKKWVRGRLVEVEVEVEEC